jgi:ribosomal protein S10
MSDIQREHILTYWLKAPKGSHKTFSIWFRKKDLKTQKTIEHGKYTDERTEILNVMLKSGKKKFESVKKEFNKIVKELQEQEEKLRGKIPILGENEVVFDEFWQRRYAHKRNIDLESAKNETLRAIQAVGEVPLISARVHEIQNAVDKHCDGDRDKQRRTISRLKTILRVIGRIDVAEKLDKDRKIHRNPTHITYRDLADLVNHTRNIHIIDPISLLVRSENW